METKTERVNNAFYDELGSEWYGRSDHPIALLRSENRLRNPWIEGVIQGHFSKGSAVLDVGCGGGFLTNYLAEKGYRVSGIDLSEESLAVAKKRDQTGKVEYLVANGYALPFADASFSVVCCMDVLEHVADPGQIIQEASRVLKKGGLFFFHTFNRTLLSYLLVIKGVDWFVANAPKQMHVQSCFIKPKELISLCSRVNLVEPHMIGIRPDMGTKAFWKMVCTRKVPEEFSFRFTPSLATGYAGYVTKTL